MNRPPLGEKRMEFIPIRLWLAGQALAGRTEAQALAAADILLEAYDKGPKGVTHARFESSLQEAILQNRKTGVEYSKKQRDYIEDNPTWWENVRDE